ncbi:MAG: prolyl oligopeptidase family serine peptidase [Betaproteobacteria bacterium]
MALATVSALSAHAQLATTGPVPYTLEDFFKPPQLSGPTISRDGKTMAATMPFKGRMNLAVINLETRKAGMLTGYEDFDVLNVSWVGNDRLLFTLGQANSPTGPGNFDGGGLFSVNKEGKELRTLFKTVRETRDQGQYVYRTMSFFRRIPGNDEEIIASGNMTVSNSTDLYRLNIKNGRYTLLTLGRPAEYSNDWIMDSKLVPRVVSAGIKDTLTEVVYYRKDENSPWGEIARFDRNKGPTFVPLAFESDDQTLQVAYNGGRDTMAVYRYDPNSKKMGELLAQHARYDMGATADGNGTSGVVIDDKTEKVIGYSVNGAKPEIVWLDEKNAAIQASLDRTLPNRINRFRRLSESTRVIVTSYSDTSPGRWYLHDTEKRTIEEIGASRPWMEGKFVEQRPFTFTTRDGLEVTGYYFLPKNYKAGAKLPTIVHIHGGPHARADTWGSGFGVREGQLFASRGYAVIVPNFRITPGMGSKLYYAGFGTVGRQMSDDHEDALKWGIAQGFVDPARVCISGASYGGYAALQALVRSNDMWKCAVAGLAVTDYKFQLTTQQGDTANSEAGVTYWKSLLGTTDLSSQLVKDISPVYNAAKIKRPVFLYAGADDIRVPLAQISNMANELESTGNPVKAFVIKKKEGHGYGTLENNVDLYTQMLVFLNDQIGK